MVEGIKDLYNEIIESRQELVCKFDEDTRILLVNDAYAKAFNKTKEELIGKSFLDLVPEEEHDKIRSHLNSLTRREPELTYQHEVISSDGSIIWHEWYDRAIFDETGKLSYFISIGRDITENKLMVEKLRYQQKFQALVMDLAIYLVNIPLDTIDTAIHNTLRKIGEFAGVDRAYVFRYDFENSLTFNTHEWCGEGITREIDNLQGVPLDYIPEWVNKHTQKKMMVIEDVSKLPKENGVRQILEPQSVKSLITVPMHHNEECLGFVGFDAVRSVKQWSEHEIQLLKVLTELIANAMVKKRTESEMVRARYEAVAANEAKSRFLANMSHEVRTPLNGILGMAEMLSKSNPNPQQQRYINIIQSSGETLQGIVRDVLDLHRIETNQFTLEHTDFSIDDAVRESVQLLELKAREKGIVLGIDRLDVPWRLLTGAKVRIKQVLINLIDNAVNYTSEGSVKIIVRPDTVKKDEQLVYVRFEVIDTGIGMTGKQQKQLFTDFSPPFFYAKKNSGGSGLGLLISKNLVDQMQGQIGIDSNPGEGTRAWFTIPLGVPDQQPKPEHTEPEKRGLVITDRKLKAVFLDHQTNRLNCSLTYISDLQNASRLLNSADTREQPFCVILVDLEFGAAEVLGFVDNLKDNALFFDSKVVLIASSQKQVNRAWIAEHDIYDILVRPVRTFEIERVFAAQFSDGIGENEIIYDSPDSASVFETSNEKKEDDSELHASFEELGETPVQFTGNVLVAEDNSVNKMLIDFILRKLGVRYTIVENGRDVINEMKKSDYDLILMDCQMPVVDGFMATSEIRSMSGKKKSKIPIIAVTAHVIKGYKQRCIAAGMNEYISKPYSARDIIKVFFKYLRLREHDKKDAPLELDKLHERFDGNERLIHNLVSKFINDSHQQIAGLLSALENGDYHELKQTGHSMKGAAALLHNGDIYNKSEQLETAVKNRSDEKISELIHELSKAVDTLEQWWKRAGQGNTPED